MNTTAQDQIRTKDNSANHWREMLRLKEAASYMGVSLSTLFRLADKHDDFPRKIRVSNRCCFYRRDDLRDWLESREG